MFDFFDTFGAAASPSRTNPVAATQNTATTTTVILRANAQAAIVLTFERA
jgi:hypothetical protein